MCIRRLFSKREKPFDAAKSMAKADFSWDRVDVLSDGSLGPIHHMSAKKTDSQNRVECERDKHSPGDVSRGNGNDI